MRRRSVSSLVSPGPRVPMPPPSRESAVPAPTRRGSRYFNCASSTWSLPSRVRARAAKMSRMSCVRSSTFRPTASVIWRSCDGESSLSKTTTSTSVSAHDSASGFIFPDPRKVAESGFGRSCSTRSTTLRAGGIGEAGQFIERALGVEPASAPGDEPDQRRSLRPCYSACRCRQNGVPCNCSCADRVVVRCR